MGLYLPPWYKYSLLLSYKKTISRLNVYLVSALLFRAVFPLIYLGQKYFVQGLSDVSLCLAFFCVFKDTGRQAGGTGSGRGTGGSTGNGNGGRGAGQCRMQAVHIAPQKNVKKSEGGERNRQGGVEKKIEFGSGRSRAWRGGT